jgi:hypothetical protein
MQMGGHGEKLTRNQSKAIAALLVCPTFSDAAQQTGIGETTLWRWMKNESFQMEYREAKRRLVDSAISRLSQAASGAVDTLVEIMRDKGGPASSRVSAAKAVLEAAVKAIELESIEQRLTALEKQLELTKGKM